MKVYEILSSSYSLSPELAPLVRERMDELIKIIEVMIEHPKASYMELYEIYKNL